MIDLQSFNIYLKVGWIKRLFSNLDGDWQKVLLFNLQSYGGERILTFQKEFSNPPDIYHRLKYFALSYLTSRSI
jgi:hypothetical protein